MPAAAASIVARLRPQIATLTPSAASACANPNPSPLDAAATAARRPVIPRSTCDLLLPRPTPDADPEISVNRARSVAQRLGATPGASRDDLGADRNRRLFRRAGTDVEPDGRHHAGDLFIGQAGFPQAPGALLVRTARPHGPEVAHLGLDRGGDRGNVELVIVGQHADRVARPKLVADFGQIA